ncbi:MAG: hypothetical protein AAF572_26730 [Cyanobacteria bacterium P01_B01_bin.77]
MVSVEPSEAGNPLVSMTKNAILQPILFVQALPCVTVQLAVYGGRLIRRPVVWIALATHGLLMLLPAVDLSVSKQEELIELEPEEAPVIEVQNLSDLIGAAPKELPPPPEPEEAPPPEKPVVAALPEEVIITDPEDIPEDLPPEEPADDSLLDAPPPDDDPADDQPSFDLAGAQQQASDRTRTLGETTPPGPILLEDSQQPFFFDMNAGNKIEAPLVSGLTDLIAFNDVTLAEKEQAILDSFISGGDNPVPTGEYGGVPLYQLVNTATHEEVGYLSIFQGSGGRTVFVGIWDSLPPQ